MINGCNKQEDKTIDYEEDDDKMQKVNKRLYLTIEKRITFTHINKKEKC
jgi:hypothetical protein